MVALSFLILVFKSQFFNENGVRVCHIREQKSSRLANRWGLEIDSQISPLTFSRFRHVVDGANMERNELFRVDRNEDCKALLINKKLTFSHALRNLFE